VYAIDRGGMAGIAQFLAGHLGFADRIIVLRDDSTSVELPERADVLVTETLGANGLDENILGSIIDARARLLRPGATIMPRQVVLSIVPVELPELHAKHVAWWGEPRYGLDFGPLRVFASNSLLVVNLDAEAHVAPPAAIIDVDLATASSTLVRGRKQFVASRDAIVHGFGLWFTATLVDEITVTNLEPRATHWGQAFLPLEYPIPLTRGARIDVHLETDDGNSWQWHGKAGGEKFDQTTWFGAAPYGRP
jgi:protein arginine N-methyltransferase 1